MLGACCMRSAGTMPLASANACGLSGVLATPARSAVMSTSMELCGWPSLRGGTGQHSGVFMSLLVSQQNEPGKFLYRAANQAYEFSVDDNY